ncbi:anion permease [Sphingomicrobium flavum]|uniref:anion permease n=1 Tax=Sphingomicrobium flavum TaxID=1229164 RepID=UPI0021AE0FB1|nr:anion permease [Sphingomicrobium flavum]
MGDELTDRQRWTRLLICIAVGAVIWFLPPPEGVDQQGWHILAVFAATILSLLLRPYPMAVMVLAGLLVLILTRQAGETSKEALEASLSGFADTTVWLVVAAFLIAGAVIRTGLGRRLSLSLIHRLGKSPAGLAYGVGTAELVLAPVVPSNTARGGGILAPIVDAMVRTVGEGKSAAETQQLGRYLVSCGAQANLITAAMFLTGMAANPLVSAAADDVAGVRFGWIEWAMGAIVPGLIALALLPQLMKRLAPPGAIDVSAARAKARDDLAALGPRRRAETILMITLVCMLLLWASGPLHGIHTTVTAFLGILALLLTRAQSWRQLAETWGAWDALVWLGGLLTMADMLKDRGVIDWFANHAATWFDGMAPLAVALGLAIIYFYSMYGFSMLTGHISAMVGAFIAVAVAAGAPPLLIVALLAYFSNLCGCLTHYSTGPTVIYFGLGYVSVPDWFRIGFFVSLFHMVIWLGIGLPWWKLLGWW